MTFQIRKLGHVNVTVPADFEGRAKDFYCVVLGLKQIPKPEGTRQNVGAWYELGETQLHLSVEDGPHNADSERHICCLVGDLDEAEAHFRANGVAIIADDKRPASNPRFFIRDPAGNLIEIAGTVESLR